MLLLGYYATHLIPNSVVYLHLISNWIAGFAFFGVAYYMNKFINRVLVTTRHESRLSNPLWLLVARQSSLFLVITMVFFFCGLGHILQGLSMFSDNRVFLEIVLSCNAIFGIILVAKLWRLFKRGSK